MKNIFLLIAISLYYFSYAQYNLKKDYDDPDFKLGEQYRKKFEANSAYKAYQKAAEKGNAAAMVELGWLLESNHVTLKNYEKRQQFALEYFQEAADKGNPNGMAAIGWSYLKFHTAVPNDNKMGESWLRKAVVAGSKRAHFWLGDLLMGTGKFDEGWQLLLKGAELGDCYCTTRVGMELYYKKKYAEALPYLIKGYESGNATSNYDIAKIYEQGLGGVPKDEKLAKEWKSKPHKQCDAAK